MIQISDHHPPHHDERTLGVAQSPLNIHFFGSEEGFYALDEEWQVKQFDDIFSPMAKSIRM